MEAIKLITEKNQIFEIIGNKYQPLSDEFKMAWGERSKLIKMKKGEVLVKHNSRSDKVWFVASGSTRAYYIKGDKKICDWFTFDPEFISAITSFYLDKPSLHQIDILSNSVLLETNKEDITYLSDKFHEFDRIGRLSATETMLRFQEKIVSIQFETAGDRLENLLRKYPTIYQKISLKDIASYIGITQETLSRLRSKKIPNLT